MTTLIALCDDLGDLDVQLPDVEVVRVPDLCAHPGRLTQVADGASALVVGLCRTGAAHREIQSVARRIGLDALSVRFLDVGAAAGDPTRLRVLATAEAERATRFGGSRPEHAKPTFPKALDRRSFLRLPLPEYVAVPAVEQDLCAAGNGCTACMSVCPNDAYRWSGGRVEVDPARCEPCGRCLTACPTGAASNPAWTPPQVHAQIRALVEEAGDPCGIAFVCSRSTRSETTPGWYPVAVPCTGMLTAGWVLAPLLLGADGVVVRRCSDTGCPLDNDELSTSAVDLAQRLLVAFGRDAAHVGTEPSPLTDPGLRTPRNLDLFTPLGEHEVVCAMAEAVGDANHVRVSDPLARTGLVRLGSACTLCGACAQGCPTDALTFTQDGSTATLTFDAAQCTACDQCLSRCPEVDAGAIAVEHVADPAALAAGSVLLLSDDLATCEGCGRPLSSQRLLDHVAALLGDEHAEMYAEASRRCLDCRASLVGGGGPFRTRTGHPGTG